MAKPEKDDESSFEQLRHEDFCADISLPKANNVTIERMAVMYDDGTLQQDFVAYYKDEPIGVPLTWTFIGAADKQKEHLAVLDTHWALLKSEVEDMVNQLYSYHLVKNKKMGQVDNSLLPLFMSNMSGILFNQRMPDEDFAKGYFDPQFCELTTISHRYKAIRAAAVDNDIQLDAFEQGIVDIETKIEEATRSYIATFSNKESGGLQLTSGGCAEDDLEPVDENDVLQNPNAWRGEDHPDDADLWREGVDLETDYSPISSSGEDEEPRDMPWRDGVVDPHDGDVQHARTLLTDYHKHLVDFTNAANHLWAEAVEQIYNRHSVNTNPIYLEAMQLDLNKSREAYERFKEAAGAMKDNAFELQLIFDAIEDEDESPQARMERLIVLASKPAQLEAIIKKSLNSNRNNENKLG